MKQFKAITISLLSLVIILSGVSLAGAAGVWRNPTATPPNNNVEAPINVGTEAQDKAGVLRVTGFRSFFDSIIDTKLQVGTTGTMPGNLTILSNGKVGAEAYCDRQGNNCVTSNGIAVTPGNNTNSTTNNTSCGAGSRYDSGWVSVPRNNKLSFNHNLGTLDTIVYYEFKSNRNMTNDSGVSMTGGAPHNWLGGFYHYFYNKTANSISFWIEAQSNVEANVDSIRVIMWKIGC